MRLVVTSAITACVLFAGLLEFAVGGEPAARFSVAPIFGDNMVLQRNMKVPVWGTAPAGTEVTVKVADQSVSAKTDAEGKWTARVGPLSAGGPHEMTVAGGGGSATFKGVLVGEVWFGSGQSNMQFTFAAFLGCLEKAPAETAGPLKAEFRFEEEIAAAQLPQLRLSGGRGWAACSPETVKNFSALAYYFGRDLHEALKVPVGLIVVAEGGTPIQHYMSREALQSVASPEKRESVKAGGAWPRVERVIPYGIAGVIWYQGEGNDGMGRAYADYTAAMVKDWRARWGQPPPQSSGAPGGDFPFLIEQINTQWKEAPAPQPGTPASLRMSGVQEAQFLTLAALANSGLVVNNDRATAGKTIAGRHPLNKKEQARRLALLARGMVYGDKTCGVWSSPLFDSAAFEGAAVRVRFRHAGDGLSAGGPDKRAVAGFAVAGADKRFYWAEAKIVDKDMVEVRCDKVAAPAAVCYAYMENTGFCNLTNSAGLPASVFMAEKAK